MFGRTVHEAKNGFGTLSVAEVLAKSSNIGAIEIGMRLGNERLYEYIRKFGFGDVSDLGLPAESAGSLRHVKKWEKGTIMSVPMGHEVTTTTIQLAQAVSIIAADGKRFPPRLILRKVRPGGEVEEPPIADPVTVIKPETAHTMRLLMAGVNERGGTGFTRARLTGYSSGGKTGSAQIFDFKLRQYRHNYYNASYAGFAPLNRPAIVIAVTLHGAREYGGVVAAPVFREVATAALRILNVPKDRPEDEMKQETPGEEVAEGALIAESSPAESEGAVEVPAGAERSEPEILKGAVVGPKVPDFAGKSLRQVVEEAAASGLPVEFVGTGVARTQEPAAGAVLPPGERIRVQFAR